MNAYLITRPKDDISWCEDDGLVIVAEDELHAERLARINSDDFAKSHNIEIKQINLDTEHVVLVSNTGA